MPKSRLLNILGISDYPVPQHANSFFFSLGGLTSMAFCLTFLTGIILSQFYSPSPDTAHSSVRYINYIPWIHYIRSLHNLSANVGFGLLIVHMCRVLFTHSYRSPRVGTYLVGLALFFIAFQLYFSGTVLKWDQEAYEALGHFLAINALLGPLGELFREDLTLSTSMLARMYALHISIFPMLFIIFVIFHGALVKQHGIAPLPNQDEKSYLKSTTMGAMFSDHVKILTLYGGVLILIIAVVSFFYSPELLGVPKPGVEVTKPSWLFWIFYPLESFIGISGILLGTAVVSLVLLFIPIIGLVIKKEKVIFKIVNTLTCVGLVTWALSLIATYFMPIAKHM